MVAPSGSTAIMEVTSHNPEIILLDLGLPDMDGVQVIQTVRSWSNTPIIVISARSEDNDKIHALDAGADDYLTKPFSVEELLARLRVTQRRLSLMTAEMFTASSVFVNGKLKIRYFRQLARKRKGNFGKKREDWTVPALLTSFLNQKQVIVPCSKTVSASVQTFRHPRSERFAATANSNGDSE